MATTPDLKMELHEEEEWIKSNIKQRIPKCGKPRRNDSDTGKPCENCRGLPEEHANTASELHIGTAPCDTYGTLKFENKAPGGKFIRMDVDTDMSLVKHLLLNVWRVPKPSWIISIIGEEGDDVQETNTFQLKLKKFLNSSFPDKNDVWVTSEGLSCGLAEQAGETVSSCQQMNIVPIGIHAWGCYSDVLGIKMNEPIPNNPSRHCKFNIFADDGVYTERSLQSFQYFRIQLEKMMAQHDEAAISIPYVTILYGGCSNIIHGVKRSIEENIPIIVLKGTGGYADVLASAFDESTEEKVYEEGQIKWTGTVIDEELRKKLKNKIRRIHGKEYGAGERLMLECLQKRELITVFSCDNENTDHESSLLYAVFGALMKSKTQAEKYRLVDLYMPEAILSDKATAAGPSLCRLLELHMCHLLKMDEAECVQFVLDYRGLDIVEFLTKEGTRFLEVAEHNLLKLQSLKLEEAGDNTIAEGNRSHGAAEHDTLLELQPLKQKEESASGSDKARDNTIASGEKTSIDEKHMAKVKMAAFKFLFDWAVKNNKKKCGLLFWKKGENLLTSALRASSVLYKKASVAENASEEKELQKHARTFRKRAIGLINQCYEKDKEQTMDLMQAQSVKDVSNKDHLSLALKVHNRKVFETDAYKEFIRRVWFGNIQPYEKITKAPQEARSESSSVTTCWTYKKAYEEKKRKWLRLLMSPMMKFSLNLAFYIIFLALFGYVLLVELHKEGCFPELAVAIWWFSLVVEEIRQFHFISTKVKDDTTGRERFVKTVKYYFGNYWNILDVICLSLFFIGAVLIVLAYPDQSYNNVSDAGRLILNVDWMFLTWRILQFLAMSNRLGPVLEMLLKMIYDLLPFLGIMVVFIMGQGIGAQIMLYPGFMPSFDFFINSLKKSFWNIFGEFFFDVIEASEVRGECATNKKLYGNDTMEQCPSRLGSYVVPFMMALYVILMNVLLLNIIIARFNHTFTKIHSETKWLAAWHQSRVTLEYYEKKLPPPFTLLHPIYILIKKLMEHCKENQCPERTNRRSEVSGQDGSDKKKDVSMGKNNGRTLPDNFKESV